MVLVGPSADANFRIIPRKTDGTAVLKVNNGTEYALSKNLTAGEWNAIALVYNENDTEGTVAVYLNGEEVLARQRHRLQAQRKDRHRRRVRRDLRHRLHAHWPV